MFFSLNGFSDICLKCWSGVKTLTTWVWPHICRPVHNLTGPESRIYFLKYKETIYYEHPVAISKDLVDWGEALAGTEVNIATL